MRISLPTSAVPCLRRAAAVLAAAGGCALSAASTELRYLPLFGQRMWTQAHGLPSNEIAGLCQDRAGFLWVSTPAGLVRFDGSRFVRFETAADRGDASTGYAAIHADPSSDALWIAGRSGGLWRLEAGQSSALPLPADWRVQPISGVLRAADGALWLAFRNGTALRLAGATVETFDSRHGLPAGEPIHLASDGTGRIWLAGGAWLARYAEDGLHPVSLGRRKEDVRITSARRDGPWVITRGWLLKVVDSELRDISKISGDYNAMSLQACIEDSHGALWMGSRARGLRRIKLTTPMESDLAVRTPEDISALLEDAAGNIWAGSNGGGLVRVRAGAVQSYDKNHGLLENHSLAVCQDATGTMWFANRDGGVAYVNETKRVLTLAALPVRDTFSVFSIAPASAGGVWAATSHGLLRADRKRLFPADEAGAPPQPPRGGDVHVMHAAADGDLWLAPVTGGLLRLHEGEWTVLGSAEGLPAGAVQSIAEDPAGRVWVGGLGGWVGRFEAGRFAPVALAGAAVAGGVQAIHFDAAGRGWLGTEGAGVLRVVPESARALDSRHGLASNQVTQVISDGNGVVWFGSPAGIFHLRGDELDAFFSGRTDRVDPVVLGADEGLVEATCLGAHQPSNWRSRDDLLWFATRQGVVAVDPRVAQDGRAPLRVRIDRVVRGGREFGAAVRARFPADAHPVEFSYSTLCLGTPDRVRARYRLQGFDGDWTRAEASGSARYTRLPPGTYRFEVTAALAGLPGSEVAAALDVEVEAAWWQTYVFRASAAVALLLAIVGAARLWSHRRLRMRLAQLERDSLLEQERARIAQNIHDELGAGLTRVSLLTQFADERDGRAQLDKIYDTVSGLTQAMDEIVWAVNPKFDDLEGLANYLAEYAQGFLSDAGLRCRVLLPEFLPPRPLTTQFRHHLFLGCKEALNNVVKHARAAEVSVRLGVEGDRLTITIADDGRGFDVAAATSAAGRPGGGNGLANLSARLAALGGRCDLASSSAGTAVTFTAPLVPPPTRRS